MILSGTKAYELALRNKNRKYPSQTDQRYRPARNLYPSVSPGFMMKAPQSVFTIGSCFARNVERVLLNNGFEVPTVDFSAPEQEAPGLPNRVLNQYNPGTMMQCVSHIATESAAGLYEIKDGQFIDCLLATGARPVSFERAMERRGEKLNCIQKG